MPSLRPRKRRCGGIAQHALALCERTRGGDDQTECDVGDVLVIDLAAVGDLHVALGGVVEIDAIDAHAEADDAAKLRQRVDHGVGNADMTDCDSGANVGAIGRPVHDVKIAEPRFEEAERRMNEKGWFAHGRLVRARRCIRKR
jgi:hypothetical protein